MRVTRFLFPSARRFIFLLFLNHFSVDTAHVNVFVQLPFDTSHRKKWFPPFSATQLYNSCPLLEAWIHFQEAHIDPRNLLTRTAWPHRVLRFPPVRPAQESSPTKAVNGRLGCPHPFGETVAEIRSCHPGKKALDKCRHSRFRTPAFRHPSLGTSAQCTLRSSNSFQGIVL